LGGGNTIYNPEFHKKLIQKAAMCKRLHKTTSDACSLKWSDLPLEPVRGFCLERARDPARNPGAEDSLGG